MVTKNAQKKDDLKELLKVMEKLEDLHKSAEQEPIEDKYHKKEVEGYCKGINRAIALLNSTNLMKDLKADRSLSEKKKTIPQSVKTKEKRARQRKVKSR